MTTRCSSQRSPNSLILRRLSTSTFGVIDAPTGVTRRDGRWMCGLRTSGISATCWASNVPLCWAGRSAGWWRWPTPRGTPIIRGGWCCSRRSLGWTSAGLWKPSVARWRPGRGSGEKVLVSNPGPVMRGVDLLPELASVRCPALVVAGDADPVAGWTPRPALSRPGLVAAPRPNLAPALPGSSLLRAVPAAGIEDTHFPRCR